MKQLSMQLEGQKRPWNFLVADRPKRPRGGCQLSATCVSELQTFCSCKALISLIKKKYFRIQKCIGHKKIISLHIWKNFWKKKKHQSFLKPHTPHSTTLPATLAQCLGFLCHQLRGRVSIVVVVVYPPIKEQSQMKGYYIGIPYLLIYRGVDPS